MEHRSRSGQIIQVRQGDITLETCDAIVNAANSQLSHGGGVAGAIVRRGGPAIQEESDAWVGKSGAVPTGHVAVTGPGRLSCRFVIHSVGPVWRGGERNEDKCLRSAVWNSLLKAHRMELASIAFPAISSGIFGFPKNRCAAVFIKTIFDFCEEFPESPVREIRLTNIDQPTVGAFEAELGKAG
ncbi:MAG: macro domain-containing protein [Elusimicrobia bacterium]|nr:macro domain-containing protein [Elusimicrobiota bacterium]